MILLNNKLNCQFLGYLKKFYLLIYRLCNICKPKLLSRIVLYLITLKIFKKFRKHYSSQNQNFEKLIKICNVFLYIFYNKISSKPLSFFFVFDVIHH